MLLYVLHLTSYEITTFNSKWNESTHPPTPLLNSCPSSNVTLVSPNPRFRSHEAEADAIDRRRQNLAEENYQPPAPVWMRYSNVWMFVCSVVLRLQRTRLVYVSTSLLRVQAATISLFVCKLAISRLF
jgi:hypothetical protein